MYSYKQYFILNVCMLQILRKRFHMPKIQQFIGYRQQKGIGEQSLYRLGQSLRAPGG
jgi:hypothetical protein